MTTKPCTKCGVTKPLVEYHRDKTKRDGRQSQCKTCVAERKRRYHEANREEVVARSRRWREANLEKEAERNRRYHEANPEKRSERNRRYHAQHPDTSRERSRRNHESYRELSRAMATVPAHTPWSSDEDSLLMADNGMTFFQKAIELGRTYGAAVGRRDRLRARLATA